MRPENSERQRKIAQDQRLAEASANPDSEIGSFMTDEDMVSGGSQGTKSYAEYAEPVSELLAEAHEAEIQSDSDNSNAGRARSAQWKKGEKKA